MQFHFFQLIIKEKILLFLYKLQSSGAMCRNGVGLCVIPFWNQWSQRNQERCGSLEKLGFLKFWPCLVYYITPVCPMKNVKPFCTLQYTYLSLFSSLISDITDTFSCEICSQDVDLHPDVLPVCRSDSEQL